MYPFSSVTLLRGPFISTSTSVLTVIVEWPLSDRMEPVCSKPVLQGRVLLYIGKSTFLKLLDGSLDPTDGAVRRHAKLSIAR